MRRGKDVSSFLSEFDSVTHVPRPNNAKNTNRLNNKNHTLPTHPFNFPRAANLFNVAAGNVHQLLSYLYDRSIFPSSRLIVRSKIKRCKSLPSCSFAFVFFFPPRSSFTILEHFPKNLFVLQTSLNFLFPPPFFTIVPLHVFEGNNGDKSERVTNLTSKARMEVLES